jgi:ATP-dependent metalloprotease
LQELKQRATGALDEPLTAPGMTEKQPLHVVMVSAYPNFKNVLQYAVFLLNAKWTTS